MVDGIGPTSTGKIGAIRAVQPAQTLTRAAAMAKLAAAGAVPNPAADLAALGPVVDTEKVAALKQAIATGSYHADPQAIAQKMVELDVPASAPVAPAAPAANANAVTPAAPATGGNGPGK